jgi:hypothetical protein
VKTTRHWASSSRGSKQNDLLHRQSTRWRTTAWICTDHAWFVFAVSRPFRAHVCPSILSPGFFFSSRKEKNDLYCLR